jgi:transcriptional regulator with XRE-family HTH domain
MGMRVPLVNQKKCRYSELSILTFDEVRRVATPLGEKIRKLRKEKGYTLDKLAELSESSKSYIWELENKNPPRPSAEKLAKIAVVLGVTGDYLIGATETAGVETASDEAFFRKYRRMDQAMKDKVRKLADLIGEEG